MIGYVTFGTNDIERSRRFYDALLGEIGASRIMDGDKFTAWGVSWDKPGLGVLHPHDGNAASVGNGTMVALVVDRRELVDRIHAKAMELGGEDEGRPGLRGDEGPQAFYAAYFRDPDGNKLNVFRMGPA